MRLEMPKKTDEDVYDTYIETYTRDEIHQPLHRLPFGILPRSQNKRMLRSYVARYRLGHAKIEATTKYYIGENEIATDKMKEALKLL